MMRGRRGLRTALVLLVAVVAALLAGCTKSPAKTEAEQQQKSEKMKSFMQGKMKSGGTGAGGAVKGS
jgi:outer membrane biogenesis lipoprotein LolB